MSIDEAFAKWYAGQDHSGLPWQTSREELFNVFYAGWHAHIEAIKQPDLFPGTWHKDGLNQPFANEAATELHPPCKREAAGSSPAVGSMLTPCQISAHLVGLAAASPLPTAEDIYAAYPRKVGKQAAIKAIKKAIKAIKNEPAHALIKGCPLIPAEHLLEKTQAYAAAVKTWPVADKQFIPHPATWFNRGSYDDDPKEWQRGAATTSQFSKTH